MHKKTPSKKTVPGRKKPSAAPKHPVKAARRRKAMGENNPQSYGTPASTGPQEELVYPAGREPTSLTAEEVDPNAAAAADDAAKARVERERKIPSAVPDLSHLSPNERIQLALAGAVPRATTEEQPNEQEDSDKQEEDQPQDENDDSQG
jgi:hypothetical protein